MPTQIAITALSLNHFRNYTQMRIETDTRPVILTGHNGAGKTNLLEAVSFLAPGRGMRKARLAEIDRKVPVPPEGGGESKSWTLSAHAETVHGSIQIGTGRDPESGPDGDKRLVRIEGKAAKSHTELARYISLVWLTPQMDQLFQEGGSARRKFLDRLVYNFEPEHASRVNAYEYAMRERNRLLTDYRADAAWLSTLEHKMAENGIAISLARLQTAAHINEMMRESPLSFPKAEMKVEGFLEEAFARGDKAVEVESTFQSALEANRREDAAAGRTRLGAHRSQLIVTHLEKGMEAEFCSTGEQKALLLAIVLAEARAGSRWHDRIPIILLDEVVAHLDAGRRLELFQEICQIGAQTWMTGTDASLFDGMQGKAQFFSVSNASVIPT